MILAVSITLIIQSMVASLRATQYVAYYSQAGLSLENKLADLMRQRFIEPYDTQRETYAYADEDYELLWEGQPASDPYQSNIVQVHIEALGDTRIQKDLLAVNTYLLTKGVSDESEPY
jgi:hypothetical protein